MQFAGRRGILEAYFFARQCRAQEAAYAYNQCCTRRQRTVYHHFRGGAGGALRLPCGHPHRSGYLPGKAGVREKGYHPCGRGHGCHPAGMERRRQAAAPGRASHPHLPQLHCLFQRRKAAGGGYDHRERRRPRRKGRAGHRSLCGQRPGGV